MEEAQPVIVRVAPSSHARQKFGQPRQPEQPVVMVRHRCGFSLARATGDGDRLAMLEPRRPEVPAGPDRYRFDCRCGAGRPVIRRDRLRVLFAAAVRAGEREILLD